MIAAGMAAAPDRVDVVVIGLGVTGAGVALDAATRGLSVLAVDRFDLAWGTSRFSSKLVHGGLRYLASGQVGVAHESAVERGILMETTAPHLTHPLATMIPLAESLSRPKGVLSGVGLVAGDLLRRAAHTSRQTLPTPRRIDAAAALSRAPALRRDGLRGAWLGWDGQLEDDARLVTTIARTAAQHGAAIRTRARVVAVTGSASEMTVEIRDELTGATHRVAAGAVINAAGVWAGDLDPSVRLRPSRGTHLVLRPETIPGLSAAVFVPIPGELNRFVLVLPQPDGQIYVGLTDEPVDLPVPDVAQPSETEIGFLLDITASAFSTPVRRSDVVGSYAGLRPLLDMGSDVGSDMGSDTGATSGKSTADISRRHAVLVNDAGMVTIVGGKLTTYRRMAQDAVDAAVEQPGWRATLQAGPCVTATTPLAGAAPRAELAARIAAAPSPGHARLLRRFGTDADLVLANAEDVTGLAVEELLEPIAAGIPTTLAELVFGLTHEGAHDESDLLDRRTRIGLIPADRDRARVAARQALALTASR